MPVRRRGESWVVDFRAGGERFRLTLGAEIRTQRQAESEERRLRAEAEARARAPTQAERPRAAFSGFAKVWLDEHVKLRRKPSVHRGYEQAVRVHLVPHFGDRQLQAITRRDVESFVARLAATPHPDTGRPRAPKSVNNVLGVLSSMLSTAVEWGYLERSPCAGVEPLPVPVDAQEFTFYTRAQSDLWLSACASREPAIYLWALVAFRTGLRIGELAALRWADVDLERGVLHVRRSWYRGAITTPKGGRPRVVDLPGSALEPLRRAPRLAGCELVFPNGDGTVVTRDQLKAPWERVTEAAGLPRTTPHDARHSYASQLVIAGARLDAVQRLLGHTDIRVTMRYAHLAPDERARAVALLDGEQGVGHKVVTALGVVTESDAPEAENESGGGGSRTKRGRPAKLRLIRAS